MECYEEMYHFLFNAITDGLSAMETGRPGEAEWILKTAQQLAEERYIQKDAT